MTQAAAPATVNLGFLTVLQEGGNYTGGYLVTNSWGRPVEFRLTSAVQPNRVQQILYAGTLQSYLCAELIGKTLVEKTGIPVQLLFTDKDAVLELRMRVNVPVVYLLPAEDPRAATLGGESTCVRAAAEGRSAFTCHPRFATDTAEARQLVERLEPAFDLSEPFVRIREAISEARRLGVARKE
jgi:hypothetical protein